MQWENLTSSEFNKARKKTGVCLLGVGCVEKHGEHLPLGTDYLNVHHYCVQAAEKEPAMVFPPYYFSQIHEARCFPGTVAIDPVLLYEFFLALLDEIARNGFEKIIIVNGHGGNCGFLEYVLRGMIAKPRKTSVYLFDLQNRMTPEQLEIRKKLMTNPGGGHGDEDETSITLAGFPELVRMDKILPEKMGKRNNRLDSILKLCARTTLSWYAAYPNHYAGDASAATPEKGRALLKMRVETLATFIRAVKKDKVMPALTHEFNKRSLHH